MEPATLRNITFGLLTALSFLAVLEAIQYLFKEGNVARLAKTGLGMAAGSGVILMITIAFWKINLLLVS